MSYLDPELREDSAHWPTGPTLSRDQFGSFYHGTPADIAVGDRLIPGGPERRTNYRTSSSEHVYSTTNEDIAWSFAEDAGEQQMDLYGIDSPGRPRVYKVEPEGDLHEDPERIPSAYRSRTAQVVGELPGPRGSQLKIGGGYTRFRDIARQEQQAEFFNSLKATPSEADDLIAVRGKMIHELAQQDLFGEKETYPGMVRSMMGQRT